MWHMQTPSLSMSGIRLAQARPELNHDYLRHDHGPLEHCLPVRASVVLSWHSISKTVRLLRVVASPLAME